MQANSAKLTGGAGHAVAQVRTACRGVLPGVICWAYLAATIVGAVGLRLLGDHWWVATLLSFGARWPWAAPLVLLIPAAIVCRSRRSIVMLSVAAILAVGVIMDVRVPWRAWCERAPAVDTAGRLRVVTWNAHWCEELDGPAASAWFATERPDVIALEEWPRGRSVAPLVGEGAWHRLDDRELCVLSRFPIRRAWPARFGPSFGPSGSGARYVIDSPAGEIPLAVVHLASPHFDFAAALRGEPDGPARVRRNTARRWAQAAEVDAWARGVGGRALVLGDLNTTSDSPIFRGLQRQLADAFQTAGAGFGWTYAHRGALARIDHVLFGATWSCRRCAVGPPIGSPHRPVIAELKLRE